MVRESSANPLLTAPNHEWALDFVSDALASGRGLRALTIVDSYTRECPAIEVAGGICSRQVTRTLERIMEGRGKPKSPRCDNGPEFTSRHFLAWCEEQGIVLNHIQPGKPMPKRPRGKLQRPTAGRVFERELVSEPGGREAEDRKLAGGIQRGAAAQQPGLPDAGGVRESLLRTHQQDGRHPAGPPVELSGRTAVLAGKGSLRRAKAARPCPLRAAVQSG
jgi:hypothetical protein